MNREWDRYEGNALRDLFRELRFRFLRRHAAQTGRVLDVGCGPGRFTAALSHDGEPTVLLDLSFEMLRSAKQAMAAQGVVDAPAVRGSAASPPFQDGSFALVAVLGNVLGNMPGLAWPSLAPVDRLVAPKGRLLFEIVPGVGERSAYLSRLPSGAATRLLRSPIGLVRGRVLREGFLPAREHEKPGHGFRRLAPAPSAWERSGWNVEEIVAVAPALGFEPEHLEAARGDPKAWEHLLGLEQELGRSPERWENAAALLVALRRS